MDDPRRKLVTYLPGLATHFWIPRTKIVNGMQVTLQYSGTPCGTIPPERRRTTDPSKVNCRRCLKTKVWTAAWKEANERHTKADKA